MACGGRPGGLDTTTTTTTNNDNNHNNNNNEHNKHNKLNNNNDKLNNDDNSNDNIAINHKYSPPRAWPRGVADERRSAPVAVGVRLSLMHVYSVFKHKYTNITCLVFT